MTDTTPPLDPRAHAKMTCNRMLLQVIPRWFSGAKSASYVGLEERPDARQDEILLGSELSLQGPGVQIKLVVVAAPETMDTLMPALLRSLPRPPCLIDWAGEFTNQVAGKLQGELARAGVSVDLALPKTKLARRLLEDVTESQAGWHRFDIDGRALRVRLVLSFGKAFDWAGGAGGPISFGLKPGSQLA